MMHNLYVGTLEYLIKIEDVIIKQVGKFSETNKRARCNNRGCVGTDSRGSAEPINI